MSTKEKEEYIYVMSNQSFDEDILKVGWTRDHPNTRANSLHTSGVPSPFIVEFVIVTNNGSKLEKKIHEHIKRYRLNSNREFFKISKDTLKNILINELHLELKSIDDIMAPLNKVSGKCKYKKVDDIKKHLENLLKEADEFSEKFDKEYTDLAVTEINNRKHVIIIKDEHHKNGALATHGWEDDNERHIKNRWFFIKRDINQYKEWLDDILNNYEEIKERIGIEKLRRDNKSFKESILETILDLNKLKSEYTWVLQ